MVLAWPIRIFVLIVALGMQVRLHSFRFNRAPSADAAGASRSNLLLKGTVMLLGGVVAAELGIGIWQSWRIYQAWKATAFGKLLLPPYAPSGYFIGYAGSRIFMPILTAAAAAFACAYAARALNRHYAERFFEKEEPYFFALAVFCAGYPGFLLFLATFILLALVWSAISHFRRRGRASLYYLWFPAGILAILIVQFLVSTSLVVSFNF